MGETVGDEELSVPPQIHRESSNGGALYDAEHLKVDTFKKLF